MRKKIQTIYWLSLVCIFGANIFAANPEHLDLITRTNFFGPNGAYANFLGNSYSPYDGNYGLQGGYRTRGYGDKNYVNFNLNVCTSSAAGQRNCTAGYPDGDKLVWRFIGGLGWRKFSPYGAARKDWSDYKKIVRSRYFPPGFGW
jgi:hypothetical protein